MTEAEWLGSTDPQAMLEFLRGKASGRKLRLFACACQRRIWDFLEEDAAGRSLVEVLEPDADGLLDRTRLPAWLKGASAHAVATTSFRDAAYSSGRLGLVVVGEELMAQAALVRDVFGNPFRSPSPIAPSILAWNDRTVEKLAQAAYDDRQLPSGHLDAHRLAVLADALEEAGCADQDFLGHLRGAGPHVRGCWPVDLLLGKE